MMKVGTLAFHYAYNFGAVLQALGLIRALRTLGVHAEVIDFRSPVHYAPRLLTRRPLRWFNTRAVDRAFKRFREQHLPQSQPCVSHSELARVARNYDALIVGSDQIWNLHKPFEAAFFLDFDVPAECRRISYAACFGREDQPPAECERVALALRRFDAISVRNPTSQRVLAAKFGIEAPVTADPTLLADYSDLAERGSMTKPYTFLFAVDWHNRARLTSIVRCHRARTDEPIFQSRMTWDVPRVDRTLFGVGPREWLSLVMNCAFMITDSFHGMLFAIKFRKPFAIVFADETSARMRDILNLVGLSDRITADPSPEWYDRSRSSVPDWDLVSSRLQPCVDQSWEFLRRALMV